MPIAMKLSMRSVALVGASLLLAAVGGAIGTAAVLIIHRQVSISAAAIAATIVTVLGWAVTTTWSFRNQRQLLKYQILNEVRLQLAASVRAEQEWIGGLTSLGYRLQNARVLRTSLPQSVREKQWDYWHKKTEGALAELYKKAETGKMLVMVLEEYEILYPETRRLRHQLGLRRGEITMAYNPLIMDLTDDAKREQSIAAMIARSGGDMDYTAVLEDLRCHIQNRSISPLFGGVEVPRRIAPDKTVAVTEVDSDGMLMVMQRGIPWADDR